MRVDGCLLYHRNISDTQPPSTGGVSGHPMGSYSRIPKPCWDRQTVRQEVVETERERKCVNPSSHRIACMDYEHYVHSSAAFFSCHDTRLTRPSQFRPVLLCFYSPIVEVVRRHHFALFG